MKRIQLKPAEGKHFIPTYKGTEASLDLPLGSHKRYDEHSKGKDLSDAAFTQTPSNDSGAFSV